MHGITTLTHPCTQFHHQSNKGHTRYSIRNDLRYTSSDLSDHRHVFRFHVGVGNNYDMYICLCCAKLSIIISARGAIPAWLYILYIASYFRIIYRASQQNLTWLRNYSTAIRFKYPAWAVQILIVRKFEPTKITRYTIAVRKQTKIINCLALTSFTHSVH